jgi:hypothetical protein
MLNQGRSALSIEAVNGVLNEWDPWLVMAQSIDRKPIDGKLPR